MSASEGRAFGFARTACGCELCKAYCRYLPGALDPSDLPRLCPDGHDVFAWAEQHLRAQVHQPYPLLVPARNALGHCHWYFDGKCAVHENAPYSCAFFDAHMPDAEVECRVAATIQGQTSPHPPAARLFFRAMVRRRANVVF